MTSKRNLYNSSISVSRKACSLFLISFFFLNYTGSFLHNILAGHNFCIEHQKTEHQGNHSNHSLESHWVHKSLDIEPSNLVSITRHEFPFDESHEDCELDDYYNQRKSVIQKQAFLISPIYYAFTVHNGYNSLYFSDPIIDLAPKQSPPFINA